MHCEPSPQACADCDRIALVGHCNVGKSVLFHQLTGRHAVVSNIPGTTVEVARGSLQCRPDVTAVDTPGVVTLPSQTEDEHATERVILEEPLQSILQVGDAKNLSRTLLLTLQLAEMGIPMVLALNMMDEADQRGIHVDHETLASRLNLPVVPTVAVRRLGVEELTEALAQPGNGKVKIGYPDPIERAVSSIAPRLPEGSISSRALALLFLSFDTVAEGWLQERMTADGYEQLVNQRAGLQASYGEPLALAIQRSRRKMVRRLLADIAHETPSRGTTFGRQLGRLAMHRIWGLPILLAVLYAVYMFVGVFGAQILVEWFEGTLFGETINPFVASLAQRLLPWEFAVEFLVGEYGLWTVGMTYALALILPIVTTFFLAFGLLEDSGYFSRLAALTNRMFRSIGLNGKAVLPMILGLGCVTMATLTTRTLESRRERLLVILLLALAVPCSAQLGVVMGMLAGISLGATAIWGFVLLAVLLSVGWLAHRLMPGERHSLMLELPPMRLPVASNVIMKTLARLEWYLREVIPLFLLGTAIMFTLDQVGILPWLVRTSEPLTVAWLGLPAETSEAFLLGFLRRDFGAAGLFAMGTQGLLTPVQTLVAIVTITLFVPCVASIFMIAKERGWRTAVAMAAFIFPLAFLVGGLLHRVLNLFGGIA